MMVDLYASVAQLPWLMFILPMITAIMAYIIGYSRGERAERGRWQPCDCMYETDDGDTVST